MKVLITGATGFVGSHLIDFLLTKSDVSIFGARRRRSDMGLVDHVKDKVQWVEIDVADSHNVDAAIKEIQPNYIFHLAAQSFVPTSWKAPLETFTTNAIGTLNILEALKNLEINTKIQIAGSSEEYGLVKPEEIPITENNLLNPQSPYGVSKVTADLLGRQYYGSYGIHVVVTRAFNHTGPRRGEMFVVSDFSKQIAETEKGLRGPVIYVGDLEAKRDFLDVRDIVRAYWLALVEGEAGEAYNICSGETIRIREVLSALLALSSAKIVVKQDPSKLRPSDVPLLQGDCSKFKSQTGWEPMIPFEETLRDTLEYWRQIL